MPMMWCATDKAARVYKCMHPAHLLHAARPRHSRCTVIAERCCACSARYCRRSVTVRYTDWKVIAARRTDWYARRCRDMRQVACGVSGQNKDHIGLSSQREF